MGLEVWNLGCSGVYFNKNFMMGHRDLKDRTMQFALRIIAFVKELPDTPEARIIKYQLLKAGTSVGANTRASFRARSTKEYVSKLGTVIEEGDESAFWLEVLQRSGVIPRPEVEELQKEAEALTAIFVSIREKYKR